MSEVRTVHIGPEHRTRAEVIGAIARALGAPSWFGGNLDALFDFLTTDAEGPIEIVWELDEEARRALGADFQRLRACLLEAARERDDLVVRIAEPPLQL